MHEACPPAWKSGGREPGSDFLLGKALDRNMFGPALLTGYKRERGFGQAKQFGKKGEHGPVGLAIHGRGGQTELEGIIVETGQFVSGGAGLDMETQNNCAILTDPQTIHGLPDGHGKLLQGGDKKTLQKDNRQDQNHGA
jgi:hypothetical protein